MTYFAANPFFDAYTDSDLIGKAIFLLLVFLSIISWSILVYKIWLTKRVRGDSAQFKKIFHDGKHSPLTVKAPIKMSAEYPNAFFIIYEGIQKRAVELMEKNSTVAVDEPEKMKKQTAYLSSPDIDLLANCAQSTISALTKYLDQHVYILSTIVTLAPFLGLLGTVYGILTTFSGMQGGQMAGSNQEILGGLSLALTTTVIGLIDAIPAVVGYNYLRNSIYAFDSDMGRFATDVLANVELHYRKVEQ